VAEELLRLAERHSDSAAKILGCRALGVAMLFHAEFNAALSHLQYVLATYDPELHRFPIAVPADSRVASLHFTAWVMLYQGHLGRALTCAEEALEMARGIGHPYTLAFALHVNCLFHQVRKERQSIVKQRSAELVALASEHGFAHLLATGTFFHGWAQFHAGVNEAGLDQMQHGLAAKRAGGAEIKVPYYLGLLASAYAVVGEPNRALSLLGDALDRVEDTGERWFEAELHRRKGQILRQLPRPDLTQAETCFRYAQAIAQKQGAKLWELRATTDLARLWREQGRRAEASDLLAPIYGWFSEGFDTADLMEAKALLDELQWWI
jgi:predicted ATPase